MIIDYQFSHDVNDFMKIGTKLQDPNFGPRYLKYSGDPTEHGMPKAKYFGEWSSTTNKPHGRGIYVRDGVVVYIGFFTNGNVADNGTR